MERFSCFHLLQEVPRFGTLITLKRELASELLERPRFAEWVRHPEDAPGGQVAVKIVLAMFWEQGQYDSALLAAGSVEATLSEGTKQA
ncbi:hypothetical protein SG18_27145 [Pandoraea apista]|nr:hypothetical protein SG18_27145 [Pandoraea apista]